MASVSVTKAAELTGVTRRTIYRDVSSGKLSAAKNSKGKTVIETAELIRVYGELSQKAHSKVYTGSQSENPDVMSQLLAEMTQMREEIQRLNKTVESLQGRLALPAPVKREQSVLDWLLQRRKRNPD